MKKYIKYVFIVISLVIVGFLYHSYDVYTINDNSRESMKVYTIKTIKNNTDSILNLCDIQLSDDDKVEIKDKTINITRAYDLKIQKGTETIKVRTTKYKVRDILKEQNIIYDEDDEILPSIDGDMKGDTIFITYLDSKVETVTEEIPFYSEVVFVENIKSDQKMNEGENGLKEVTYHIIYKNGKEIKRELVEEKIIKEPVNEVINKKDESFLVTSRGLPFRYSKILSCKATAYDLTYESCAKNPGDPGYGITFTGTHARPGVIAVDPRYIPLGTKVYIKSLDSTPDYGFAIAEDTGSAVKGYLVDLFISDPKKVRRYGKRNVLVYIISDPIDKSLYKGYSEK